MDIRDISILEARSIRREVLRPGRPESEVAYPGDGAEGTQHLGVFEGDTLLGVATFLREACPGQDEAGSWRLRGMATVPSAQGRGLGSQLLLHGVQRAVAQRRYDHMVLRSHIRPYLLRASWLSCVGG